MNRHERRAYEAQQRHRGEGIDKGFEDHTRKLRELFPKITDKDIGLAWMREEGAGADVTLGTPDMMQPRQDCVMLHLIFGLATLNTLIPVKEIDNVVAYWRKSGLSRNETKNAIFAAMALSQNMISGYADVMCSWALALAFTSPDDVFLRARAEDGWLRVAYNIETWMDGSRRAINFRLIANDQRTPLSHAMQAAMAAG